VGIRNVIEESMRQATPVILMLPTVGGGWSHFLIHCCSLHWLTSINGFEVVGPSVLQPV